MSVLKIAFIVAQGVLLLVLSALLWSAFVVVSGTKFVKQFLFAPILKVIWTSKTSFEKHLLLTSILIVCFSSHTFPCPYTESIAPPLCTVPCLQTLFNPASAASLSFPLSVISSTRNRIASLNVLILVSLVKVLASKEG